MRHPEMRDGSSLVQVSGARSQKSEIALSTQHSALSTQHSALSTQHSVLYSSWRLCVVAFSLVLGTRNCQLHRISTFLVLLVSWWFVIVYRPSSIVYNS